MSKLRKALTSGPWRFFMLLLLLYRPCQAAPLQDAGLPADSSGITAPQPITRESSIQPRMEAMLFRIVAVSAVLLILLIAGLKGYNRLTRSAGAGAGIKVLARQYLAPRQFLLIIAVEERRFLVGSSDQQINLLAELDSAEEIPPSENPLPRPHFLQQLKGMMK